MAELRQVTDFADLSREDTVTLNLGPATSGSDVEFLLESAPDVTWWKGIEIRSADGRLLGAAQTEDADHGIHPVAIPMGEIGGAYLTLAKRKMFGFHTGMYELWNLSGYVGRSFHFLWQRDEDSDGPVAGFFRDLGGGIVAAADAVADAVGTVIDAVADVVGTVIEAVGNFVAGIFFAIGDVLGGIPLIGGFLRGVFHWVGNIISGVFDFVATVIRGVLNVVANVIRGVIRVVVGGIGGLIAWDGRTFVRGLGDIVAGVAGAVILIGLKFVALVQAVLFMQWERALTPAERSMLLRVYRKSVSLDPIRIVDGFAGLLSSAGRPLTVGHKIYMQNTPPADYPETLVHECCHVWQNQHRGTRYIADAAAAQAFVPDPYDWEKDIRRGYFRWQEFNSEAQASFLQDVYRVGRKLTAAGTTGTFYDDDPIGFDVEFISGTTDRTSLARDTIAYVRSAKWR